MDVKDQKVYNSPKGTNRHDDDDDDDDDDELAFYVLFNNDVEIMEGWQWKSLCNKALHCHELNSVTSSGI